MNPFEMVVMIVAIVMIAGIFKARYGVHHRSSRFPGPPTEARDDAETIALREEVRTLKERIAVLERIATEPGNRLEQEIDQLRDR
jgi:hypothetical protein